MMQFHQIQSGQTRPRSPTVLVSARRANSACGGRANSTLPTSAPFKRSKIAQALIDILFVGAALLLVSSAAVTLVGSTFILFFVRT